MTISEFLVNDISENAYFMIVEVQARKIRTATLGMERVRVLCNFARTLVTQKYLEAGAWGDSVSILSRIVRDIEAVCTGYNGWNDENVAQKTVDEIRALKKLLGLRMRSEDYPIVDCYV